MKQALGLVFSCAVMTTAAGCAAPQKPEPPDVRSTALLSAAIKTPAPATAESSGDKDEKTAAETKPEPEPLPTACESEQPLKDAKACLPPAPFAKKLCSGIYPEVALGMFAKGTPWTRVWLAGDVEAWNASGGLTHRARLAFDEEVIVLSRHGAASMGGIVMTGAQASFDVLRWDGSCVSVMEGELTTRRPPAPKPAPVPWGRLEETTRRALLASPKVKSTHAALEKACSSFESGAEKKPCAKAEKALMQAVVDYVRSGATLPTPARRP
jgi:hypothetical protein